MGSWQIAGSSGSFEDMGTTYGYNVEQQPGTGMAAVDNLSTAFGLLDGAIYQRSRAEPRIFSLIGTLRGSTIADLHIKRKNLIQRIAFDRSASTGEPVVLRYTGGALTLQASCHYKSGLELGTVKAKTEAKIALAFEQFDPYWEKTTSSSATLTTQASFTANAVAQRAACGAWGPLSTGFNSTVYSITSGSDGTLYFGGAFTTAAGATACRVAQWNGATLSKVGNAVNNEVYSVIVGRDGYLYAGGLFSTASNLAASNVARWSGTQWQTMASGTNGTVQSGIVDNEANIVFGGLFTAGGGGGGAVAACAVIKWNVGSSAWQAIGLGLLATAPGQQTAVYDVAVAKNGDIWATGLFRAASVSTNTACRVAYYSQSASRWYSPASGLSSSLANAGRSVAITSDGIAHLGLAAGIGTTAYYISNGIGLFAAASITDGNVYSINTDNEDIVYLGGDFDQVNGISAFAPTCRFIKGTPTVLDISLSSDPNLVVYATHAASDGVLTVGFNQLGTACAPGITTITNNGTAATYPILTACAPTSSSARLIQLVNYTTGDAVYFNLILNSSEIVTLDLRPRVKTFTSNFRGNIMNTVLPGSDLTSWRLIPGANNISFRLTGSSGAAKLEWTERFWSVDN